MQVQSKKRRKKGPPLGDVNATKVVAGGMIEKKLKELHEKTQRLRELRLRNTKCDLEQEAVHE